MINITPSNALEHLKSAIDSGDEEMAMFIQDCLDRSAEDNWKEKHGEEGKE